jgi:hypothetical protein
MPNFALKKIDQVKGPIEFYELIVNGRNEVDEFFKELKQNGRQKHINKIYSLMDVISNGFRLPPTKHNFLQGKDKGDIFHEWEIKYEELRLYYFDLEDDKIVVFGAYKNKKKAQSADVKKLRALKLHYLKSLGYDNKE